MPNLNKQSRDDRQGQGGSRLCRSKKRPNPKKKKPDETTTKSASAKKIRLSTSAKVPEDAEKHYRIVDFLLVFTTISTLVKCATCGEKVHFKSCDKQGLGFKIEVKCEKCKRPTFVPSCDKIGGKYEINFRFIFVMRLLGLGSAGCDKFCGLMDLASSFLSQHVYETYIESIITNVQKVANQFFCSAANQEKDETLKENGTSELIVSGDGTWQKQGFTSLYGVSSLIHD